VGAIDLNLLKTLSASGIEEASHSIGTEGFFFLRGKATEIRELALAYILQD